MCSNSKSPLSLWPGCRKDFTYYNVLTYNQIFEKKSKSCIPGSECKEHFQSPFATKTITRPGWVTYNNQVLRFFAYFQEPIPESHLETYRVHHVQILYHLEDDTISVMEPPTYDPGFPQGRLINRQRVPHAYPAQDAYLTLQQLNVGCTVEMYGKSFCITGCDLWTRRFLNRRGVPVPLDSDPPCDLATEKRKDSLIQALMTKPANVQGCRLVDKGTRFFNNTRRVLRFWGYWDDRCNYLGWLRRFIFLFHLEDDTVEITEILDPGGGGVSPNFFRRQRLLKHTADLVHPPGWTDEGFEVLNTSGLCDGCGDLTSQDYLTDRLYTGHATREYYRDKDLAIGATISVYGRAFILTETDEFTKEYYRDKYGVQDFTPLVLDEPKCRSDNPIQVPPCGFQLDEKSVENWGESERMPWRDARSLLTDKDILSFSAIIDCPLQKVNAARRFTLKFYVYDSSIEIFELPHPNSGFPTGYLLRRSRVMRPKESRTHGPSGSEYKLYEPRDMFIGNRVHVNGTDFILMCAEEYTLCFMEKHPQMFPQSNLCLILSKVREAFGPYPADEILLTFSSNDIEKNGVMSSRDFRCLLLDLTKESLNEHQLKTLIRAFRVTHPKNTQPDMETLQSILHTELRKFGFDRMLLQRLEYNFRHYDPCHSGSVGRGVLRQILMGAKVPFRKELIDFLVDNFPSSDSSCNVNYCHVMKFLDWETYQVPDAKPAAVACILRHLCPQPPPLISCVNYRAFLDEVCPNIACALPSVCCPCPVPCQVVECGGTSGSYESEVTQEFNNQIKEGSEGGGQCENGQNGGGEEEGVEEGLHEFYDRGN